MKKETILLKEVAWVPGLGLCDVSLTMIEEGLTITTMDGEEKTIERVIFNKPATVLIFTDGTKTVVKTTEDDDFQPDHGFAMAVVKTIFGSGSSFKRYVKQWVIEDEEKQAGLV